MAIGDVNGDGVADIAVSSPDGNNITLFLMSGKGVAFRQLRFFKRSIVYKEPGDMKIKILITLCLIMGLCQSSLIAKFHNEERLSLVVPAAPWVLSLAKGNLVIDQQQIKPDGSAGYFSLNDKKNGLTVSFFIEPVTNCKDSRSCRDMVWKLGNSAWEKPQNVVKSEIDGVSYFEFFMPSFRGVPLKQQHMYVEFVIDGFWVDLHVSKVLYTPQDPDVFDQLVKSVKFEPKKAASAQVVMSFERAVEQAI